MSERAFPETVQPYSPEEVEERAAANEATVFPDLGYRRWAATVRSLRSELLLAKAELERLKPVVNEQGEADAKRVMNEIFGEGYVT